MSRSISVTFLKNYSISDLASNLKSFVIPKVSENEITIEYNRKFIWIIIVAKNESEIVFSKQIQNEEIILFLKNIAELLLFQFSMAFEIRIDKFTKIEMLRSKSLLIDKNSFEFLSNRILVITTVEAIAKTK